MQMVTMGLHGQSKPYAGEKFALFLALPDEAHREGGPLLTLPYKSGFHMEDVLAPKKPLDLGKLCKDLGLMEEDE